MRFFVFFVFLLIIPSSLAIGVYPQKIFFNSSSILYISSSKNMSIGLKSNILEVPDSLFVTEGITKLPLTYKKRGKGSLIIKSGGVDLFIPVIVERKFNGISIFLILNLMGLILGGIFWKREHFFPSR